MKLWIEIFVGASAVFVWLNFWMNRTADGWPFVPCFLVAVILPLSIVAAIIFS